MKGKVAIVTGGAGGIGSAVCRAFEREGAASVVVDMNGDRAEQVATEIVSRGGNALAVETEVTSESSVNAAVERAVAEFGRVNFLVHCAGNNIKAPVLDLAAEQWDLVLNTHLTGAFLFCKAVGKQMVKQGDGGRVVFMSSVAATAPAPERGAYTPAKAGLIGLAGVLSLEWSRYNINVNAVCPGMVMTPMTKMVYEREPELQAQRLKRMPAGREARPEEVSDLVVFLCSEKATHINGVAIPVDGAFLNNGFMMEDV